MAKVKNINGTSNRFPAGYTSWLDYWKQKSGKQIPIYCQTDGCSGQELVGGHVKKVGSTDNSWYIVPICKKKCNASTAEFDVPSASMVPVNL